MASSKPFNKAVIDSTTITTDEFVHGTGEITSSGNDVATTTNDGLIHNDRLDINKSARFEAYGNKSALNNSTGLGVTCTLSLDTTQMETGTALVTATYNESSQTTSIQIDYDPS